MNELIFLSKKGFFVDSLIIVPLAFDSILIPVISNLTMSISKNSFLSASVRSCPNSARVSIKDLMLNKGVLNSWDTLLINWLLASFRPTSLVISCIVMAIPFKSLCWSKTGVRRIRTIFNIGCCNLIRYSSGDILGST